MMYEEWRDGKLVLRWNETNKMIERMSPDGVTVASSTPMDAQQIIVADAVLAEQAAEAGRDALRAAVLQVVADMDTERQKLFTDFPEGITNATINQNPAKYIKTLEQVLRRTTAGVKDLARLVNLD